MHQIASCRDQLAISGVSSSASDALLPSASLLLAAAGNMMGSRQAALVREQATQVSKRVGRGCDSLIVLSIKDRPATLVLGHALQRQPGVFGGIGPTSLHGLGSGRTQLAALLSTCLTLLASLALP